MVANLLAVADDGGRLDAAARGAWAHVARGQRWTLWARLSWAWPVSEVAASKHVERWAARLRARAPGASVLVGLHNDAGRRHAHALVFIPRRWYDVTYPVGITVVGWSWDAWLDWRHGQVWAERFSPGRTARQHGAAEYVAKDVGTVMQFGAAPTYRSATRRRDVEKKSTDCCNPTSECG